MSDRLGRIEKALDEAAAVLRSFTPGEIAFEEKSARGDLITAADHASNDVLLRLLLAGDEGWLSEETADDSSRLAKRVVWVVDPLDGTKEFTQGLPEWSVSVGFVEDGRAVAGGICNPATDQTVIGWISDGVLLNGSPARTTPRTSLEGAVVLASRSEVERGEWERFEGGRFEVRSLGSVAYKLALVAAGLADATWTLVPKNEWDIAAGVALVLAAGGEVWTPDGSPVSFNRADTLFPGLVATAPGIAGEVRSLLGHG